MTAPDPDRLVTVHAALVAAGASVDGMRGYGDPGALLDPPAWLVSPPRIEWGTYSNGWPTTAQFVGFVIVKADPRAVEHLERYVLLVGAAIYESEAVDAACQPAFPGVWRIGAGVRASTNTDLPCYEIPIEVSL